MGDGPGGAWGWRGVGGVGGGWRGKTRHSLVPIFHRSLKLAARGHAPIGSEVVLGYVEALGVLLLERLTGRSCAPQRLRLRPFLQLLGCELALLQRGVNSSRPGQGIKGGSQEKRSENLREVVGERFTEVV